MKPINLIKSAEMSYIGKCVHQLDMLLQTETKLTELANLHERQAQQLKTEIDTLTQRATEAAQQVEEFRRVGSPSTSKHVALL